MKEVKLECPKCGREVRRMGFGRGKDSVERYRCKNCKSDYDLSQILCPICMSKLETVKFPATKWENRKTITYCANCLSLEDFYICPFQTNSSCILLDKIKCVGVGIRDSDTDEIESLNPYCNSNMLPARYVKFIKNGIELDEAQSLGVAKFVLKHRRWPNGLKITAKLDILT